MKAKASPEVVYFKAVIITPSSQALLWCGASGKREDLWARVLKRWPLFIKIVLFSSPRGSCTLL